MCTYPCKTTNRNVFIPRQPVGDSLEYAKSEKSINDSMRSTHEQKAMCGKTTAIIFPVCLKGSLFSHASFYLNSLRQKSPFLATVTLNPGHRLLNYLIFFTWLQTELFSALLHLIVRLHLFQLQCTGTRFRWMEDSQNNGSQHQPSAMITTYLLLTSRVSVRLPYELRLPGVANPISLI